MMCNRLTCGSASARAAARPRERRSPRAMAAFGATLLLLSAARAFAQDNPWKLLTSKEGLNAAVFFDIHRDRAGFIWLASQLSLARFDGRDFRYWIHDPDDSSSIGAGQAYAVREDRAGRLLVGMDTGLYRYDLGADRFETFLPTGDPTKLERVFFAIEDRSGRLWVNSEKALYRLDDSKPLGLFHLVRAHEGLPTATSLMFPLLETVDGSVWAGSPDGLFRLAPGAEVFAPVALSRGPGPVEVVALVEGPGGLLFVGTGDRGVLSYDPAKGEAASLRSPDIPRATGPDGRVLCLKLGPSGQLWIGGKKGLCRYDPSDGSSRYFPPDPNAPGGLPVQDTLVSAAEEDGAGNLWIGTNTGVAWTRIAPRPFKAGLAGAIVTEFLEEIPDSYLVGSFTGLSRWNKKTGAIVDLERTPEYSWVAKLPEGIMELVDDGRGALWLGCAGWVGDGVYRFEPATGALRHFRSSEQGKDWLPNDLVFELTKGKDGRIWAGTGAGFALYDPAAGGFQSPPLEGEEALLLKDVPVWRIEEREGGIVWVGTTKGLYRYDLATGKAQAFLNDPTSPASLSDSWILDLVFNDDGTMWVGTGSGGLDLFDPARGKLANFSTGDGLPNNMVLAIARGDGEDLWVGTAHGLAHVMGRGGGVRVYQVKDGLPSNEINGTCAGLRSSDGTVMFGTVDGFFWFSPKEVEADARPAPARLLRFATEDGKVVAPNAYVSKGLVVPWRSNAFSLDFASVDYSPGVETKFAYRLAGLDRDWVDNGTDRVAHYSQVPGGSYVFEVKATDSAGRWSPESAWARLPIRVGTHPLKTWWAICLYVAAVVGLVAWIFLSYRRRQVARIAAAEAEASRERAASERLARLDQLKDAFLANTSHELRTPLHGIVGIAESLAEGAAGEVNGAMRDNLDMISSSGRRLASLVDDILDFSRLKERDLVLAPKAVDLRSVVEVVLALTKPLIRGKELELANAVPRDLPPVQADPARLQQIVHNLVGNAVKFTAKGSVTVSAACEDSRIALSVRDTGIGIPRDKLESVFRSFEQVDASVAREYGGTGLGLTITKRLAELMGGRVAVESEPGAGSVFTVTLPRADGEGTEATEATVARLSRVAYAATVESEPAGVSAAAAAAPAAPAAPAQREALVLVVDDEPINLQVLANLLSLRSYQVVQARSGEEALRLADERKPDIVLLDVMMPRMSGYEVCERLREKFPASETPVIMLTARNQVADLVQGLESGANDYLAKPFSGDELVARIRTHLDLAKINISLARFLPREYLEILEKRSIVDLRLGDQVERDMSVMFCDIRDFTTLSEGMSPAETFAFVNEYLARVVPAIRDRGGIIDKYIGDAVMALFPDAPDAALRAALDVGRAVAAFGAERVAAGLAPVGAGIGIHTGRLILGTVGETARMQETVISDAVNLASRIEGLTKTFGSAILVSEDTRARLGEPSAFKLRFLGKVAVKGRTEPTEVFEVLDPGEAPARAALAADFERALESYYGRRFDEAVALFSAIARGDPGDRAALLYLQRSAQLIASPPGEGWDGVERPDAK